jgi:transcriptional regulator with XRE-family HTH domain
MTFGTMLREARESLEIDQHTVANETGLSLAQLWRYEREAATPSLDNALTLAAYFGLSLDLLKDAVHLPGEP